MANESRLLELRTLILRRGPVTDAQRRYALLEENAIKEMHSAEKLTDEVRLSHRRTLERYIGLRAFRILKNLSNSDVYRKSFGHDFHEINTSA